MLYLLERSLDILTAPSIRGRFNPSSSFGVDWDDRVNLDGCLLRFLPFKSYIDFLLVAFFKMTPSREFAKLKLDAAPFSLFFQLLRSYKEYYSTSISLECFSWNYEWVNWEEASTSPTCWRRGRRRGNASPKFASGCYYWWIINRLSRWSKTTSFSWCMWGF